MLELTLTFPSKLSCGKCEEVLLWIHNPTKIAANVGVTDPALIFNFVTGEVTDVTAVNSDNYQYVISYDEAQLTDPSTPLQECDVRQVCCAGCVVSYIDSKLANLTAGIQQWNSPVTGVIADNTAAIAALALLDLSAYTIGALAFVDVSGVPTWFKYDGALWTLAF